ncbi:unnamed protein product, partial [Oppiella nova]
MALLVSILCGTALVVALTIARSSCLDLNPTSKCLSEKLSNPVRFYGTKTTYTVAKEALDSTQPLDPNWYSVPNYYLHCRQRGPRLHPTIGRVNHKSRVDIRLVQNEVACGAIGYGATASIINGSEHGLTELCEQDLQSIRKWTLNMNETDDNRISDTGVVETRALAKNFKQRYPSLLDPTKAKIEIG